MAGSISVRQYCCELYGVESNIEILSTQEFFIPNIGNMGVKFYGGRKWSNFALKNLSEKNSNTTFQIMKVPAIALIRLNYVGVGRFHTEVDY